MKFRVIIADEALARMDEHAKVYRHGRRAPLEAARWLARVLAAAETLDTMPRRCPRAYQDSNLLVEVRVLNVDGFLLFFTVDDAVHTVHVLYARHGRQLPKPGEL